MPEQQVIRIGAPYKGRVTATALNDQPEGAVLDSRDFVGRDAKTDKARLSTRAGYSAVGSLSNAAGYFTLGSAYNETGAVQLMAATSTNLYRWTGSAWSSVGTITTSASRTIHADSVGKQLFVACNAPYKYYDYDADNNGTPDHTVATYSANAGTIPPNCRLLCAWGNRIVLAGDPSNPHVVNFSRVDDPFDWDFTQEDDGTAIAVPLREAVTCLIPHNRDCVIAGHKGGMSIFRDNPSGNGVVEQFAFVIGPVNSSAWCKSADDWTYILAHNGLYKMAPGCGAPPEDVSRGIIPDSLLGIDGTNSKAYLVYNERFRYVEIHVQGTNAQSWLYDVDGGGFWKITAPGASILAAYRFGLLDSTTASGSLIGTSTGTFRMDNAQAIGGSDMPYVDILMANAPLGSKILIQRGTASFGSNTTDTSATVKIYGGENAANAAAKGAGRRSSVTIAALNANHGMWFPRVGGQSNLFSITSADTASHITFEGASLYAIGNGIERG